MGVSLRANNCRRSSLGSGDFTTGDGSSRNLSSRALSDSAVLDRLACGRQVLLRPTRICLPIDARCTLPWASASSSGSTAQSGRRSRRRRCPPRRGDVQRPGTPLGAICAATTAFRGAARAQRLGHGTYPERLLKACSEGRTNRDGMRKALWRRAHKATKQPQPLQRYRRFACCAIAEGGHGSWQRLYAWRFLANHSLSRTAPRCTRRPAPRRRQQRSSRPTVIDRLTNNVVAFDGMCGSAGGQVCAARRAHRQRASSVRPRLRSSAKAARAASPALPLRPAAAPRTNRSRPALHGVSPAR